MIRLLLRTVLWVERHVFEFALLGIALIIACAAVVR